MIFISDSQLDAWLQEDIQGAISPPAPWGSVNGTVRCIFTTARGCVSAIALTCRMLARLGLETIAAVRDGDRVVPGASAAAGPRQRRRTASGLESQPESAGVELRGQ